MKLINHIPVFLTSIMVLFGSCNYSYRKDLSLTQKEFEKVGMPQPGRTWQNYEYGLAYMSISSLYRSNPHCLPRKGSNKSGKIFSRFVNPENLGFLEDTTISLRDRAILAQHFQQIQNQLANLYDLQVKEKPYYANEMIDLYIFRLIINDRMLKLAGKIMDSEAESDMDMKKGLKRVQYNYLKLLRKLLGEQVKKPDYSAKSLRELSEAVKTSLIINQQWMDTPTKENIKTRIREMLKKNQNKIVEKNYSKVLESMH